MINFQSSSSKFFLLSVFSIFAFIFFSQAIFAANTWTVAPSPAVATNFPSVSCASPSKNTISDAITLAASGDTINVCAGTCPEQLTIIKSLILVGAGALTTTIQAPPVFVADVHGFNNIVTIAGAGVNVDISGFTIQGPGPSGCGSINTGIFVSDGAKANIHDNSILHIRDDPISGCQNGQGILVGRNAFSTTGTATITNNIISDYQKGGIVVDNTGSNAIISNNVVTGSGLFKTIAQNGIQISRGATAILFNNTVTGNEFLIDASNKAAQCGPTVGGVIIPPDTSNLTDVYANCVTDVGILLYNAGNVASADNNTLTGNDVGFAFIGTSNPLINYNVIYGNRYFGIDASADTNTIDGTYNDYHTCIPIQRAYAVADVSPNVIYIPFISHGCGPIGPGTPKLTVYAVKKAILVCDSGASTPQGPNYEIGGCVDVAGSDTTTGNETFIRSGSYLFTGEQLADIVVAQDTNGAQFLNNFAYLTINSTNKVLCTDVTSQGYYSGTLWFGHNLQPLFLTLPPGGFNAIYDKIYQCIYTVTNSDGGLSAISVQVSDSISQNTTTTLNQYWYLNPQISAGVHFDTGSALTFPSAQAGTTVYSTNSLLIRNTALGGVNLAVFLTGNDLTDTSGKALCPTSNVLSINNIAYRCDVGSYFSEIYQPLPHMKQGEDCGPQYVSGTQSQGQNQCLVDPSVWTLNNNLIPDTGALGTDSILGNGEQAQCTFQLNVPFPCEGTYSASNAVDILIRAV